MPSLARLTVLVDEFSARHTLLYCRQCRKAACAGACPESAITRAPAGYWIVDVAKCTGCGACVAACPFDAIRLGPTGKALKCDTCDGSPQCVASCPSEALLWEARGHPTTGTESREVP